MAHLPNLPCRRDRDPSVHRGSSHYAPRPGSGTTQGGVQGAVQGIALNLAGRSYTKMHDAGLAADPSCDPSTSASPVRHIVPVTPANSMHSRCGSS